MMQQRLLALAVAVVGATSVPLHGQTATPKAASRSTVPPVVWAFHQERENATDNYSVTLYTNRAVGPEAQCGLLSFYPEVSDSLKRAVLRLHVRVAPADRPTICRKKCQVRLCSMCDLGKCHMFARTFMRPKERMLEVEVPREALKSKGGLRVRVSVIAKGKSNGDLGTKQPPCEEAAFQFVTNDTQSVLAPVLLLYKESSPTYLRDILLRDLQLAG